jgi:hypothetical protein
MNRRIVVGECDGDDSGARKRRTAISHAIRWARQSVFSCTSSQPLHVTARQRIRFYSGSALTSNTTAMWFRSRILSLASFTITYTRCNDVQMHLSLPGKHVMNVFQRQKLPFIHSNILRRYGTRMTTLNASPNFYTL